MKTHKIYDGLKLFLIEMNSSFDQSYWYDNLIETLFPIIYSFQRKLMNRVLIHKGRWIDMVYWPPKAEIGWSNFILHIINLRPFLSHIHTQYNKFYNNVKCSVIVNVKSWTCKISTSFFLLLLFLCYFFSLKTVCLIFLRRKYSHNEGNTHDDAGD